MGCEERAGEEVAWGDIWLEEATGHELEGWVLIVMTVWGRSGRWLVLEIFLRHDR